jgi:hypothetical protein
MLYELLKFGHLIGLILIGAGLIGVFLSDIRTRQAAGLAESSGIRLGTLRSA